MAYLGASPLASFASPSKDTFSGDNSTTEFTMGQSVGDPNQIEVFVDNVRQEPTSAYTVNGTTLTFTGTPATGSNNIYVIHKQGVIGNGLLPTSGRDSDRIGSLTVTGASTLTGNVTTSGNITAGGTLSGVTTLTTTSTATIGGDTTITGNLRSDNSADGIQLDSTDGSANAGDLILLDGTDGSATNAGSSLLYEDGTGDPANYFNNNMKFSGDVEVGDELKSNIVTTPSLRKDTSSPSFVLPSSDGTSGQAIITDASGNLSFGEAGGGKVGQLVQTVKTDVFSTSSTSFVDVTGLTVNITPSATSSKVLVLLDYKGSLGRAGAVTATLQLLRGSTVVYQVGKVGTSTGDFETYCGTVFLDSPNSTSQQTYKIQIKGDGGAVSCNQIHNDSTDRADSSITVLEITS